MEEASKSKGEERKITSRAKDFSEWYQDVVEIAELAEHAPVRGSMVIRPYGYAIWENMQKFLDTAFKKTGVENAYFPLLIPEKLLKKEEDHVEGFAPEVAVVTHAGGKELAEPLVLRPTSETIMYEIYSRWINSHRDLPLLINQWANVIRWEMRPRLFLRTTEFLWQEGHTVHKTQEEADERARLMLDVYRDFSERILAIPVIPGKKSDAEKFAGADTTYTIEGMMQDGKALQMGTSHNLGQNFSKVFNIKFLDENGDSQYGWQTSWGVSTRMIGAVIMAHSDDKGLVLPPKISPFEVAITPIWNNEETKEDVMSFAQKIEEELKAADIRTKLDSRDLRPGEKYYYWEKKGVPLRIEAGPKDILANQVVLVRRDTGEKQFVSRAEVLREIKKLLLDIHQNLYDKALALRVSKTKKVDSWEDFKEAIEEGNFVLAHWDGTKETEAKIKEETNATIRCIPFDAEEEGGKCVFSGGASSKRVVFAKAY